MTVEVDIPSLEAFLAAPTGDVARVAPATVIFAVGGTRRSAVLAGVSPQSDDYASYSRARMVACFDLFFQLGVRHLFTSLLRPGQLAEAGPYRDRLMDWLIWGAAGPEAMADYQQRGWRVRLVGGEGMPELQAAAERLRAATPATWEQTLWLYVAPDMETHWAQLLTAAQQVQAATRQEAVRALYGEDIPPATLYLGFGKPMLTCDIVPLVLIEEAQCYWSQVPGYDLDEPTLRRIIYDHAYLRRTWRKDKSKRYEAVLARRELWEKPHVLGLGQREGGFWYPLREQDDTQ